MKTIIPVCGFSVKDYHVWLYTVSVFDVQHYLRWGAKSTISVNVFSQKGFK